MKVYHGEIQEGELILSETQNHLRKRWLSSLKNSTRVRLAYTKEGPMKTHQQVKAIFALPVEMIRQQLIEMGIDICGVSPNKEMVYEILKRSCFGVGDNGETLGVSEMTIEQAMQAFENCQRWAALELSLNIPDPSPNWREKIKGENQR